MGTHVRFVLAVLCIVVVAACGFPRPADVVDDGGVGSDAAFCVANQVLRCTGNDLVRCNADGTGEMSATCALGCQASGPRCLDVSPSNGLAGYLDMAAG